MENKDKHANQPNSDKHSNQKEQQLPDASEMADDETEPVLDEQDMEENHLKEEALDKIIWDKPATSEQNSNKPELDITD